LFHSQSNKWVKLLDEVVPSEDILLQVNHLGIKDNQVKVQIALTNLMTNHTPKGNKVLRVTTHPTEKRETTEEFINRLTDEDEIYQDYSFDDGSSFPAEIDYTTQT
jgi:hypothetical protein